MRLEPILQFVRGFSTQRRLGLHRSFIHQLEELVPGGFSKRLKAFFDLLFELEEGVSVDGFTHSSFFFFLVQLSSCLFVPEVQLHALLLKVVLDFFYLLRFLCRSHLKTTKLCQESLKVLGLFLHNWDFRYIRH